MIVGKCARFGAVGSVLAHVETSHVEFGFVNDHLGPASCGRVVDVSGRLVAVGANRNILEVVVEKFELLTGKRIQTLEIG